MTTLTFKVPKEVDAVLKNLCQETQRPKSFFLRKALDRFLQEEALYQKALDRLNDSSDEFVSAKEMDRLIV